MPKDMNQAPMSEFRVTLDATTWSRGYDDGLAGLKGDVCSLSYSSGLIEGKAQRLKLAEEMEEK
jgi:hypothetical protein